MIDIALKALVENWPSAAMAGVLAVLSWRLRGWKDVIEGTARLGKENQSQITAIKSDVDKIKGHLRMNGVRG